MPEMVHPVTGATKTVAKKDQKRFEENGWQDATPYGFKDNSWAAVNGRSENPASGEGGSDG